MYIERFGIDLQQDHADAVIMGAMGWRKIRETTGLSEHKSRGLVEYLRSVDRTGATGETSRGWAESGGTATCTLVTPEVIKTKEDLFRAAKIDPEEWDVETLEVKTWNTMMKGPDDQPIVIQMHGVRAVLKRRKLEKQLRELVVHLLDDIAGAGPVITKRVHEGGEHLLVLSFPDPHFGADSLSLGEAEARFQTAVDDLVSKSKLFSIDRVLVVVGNDAVHVDTLHNTTTKGTVVETNGSPWHAMFRSAFRSFRYLIDAASALAPVDVYVIRGNHDELSAFALGEVLWAYYQSDANVTVNNDPALRKYYRYHGVLLGLTHGKYEKHDSLPMLMAQENPVDWSETIWREWHVGHLHHRKMSKAGEYEELMGVLVRISPSLADKDGYHKKFGFWSIVGAEAHIYSKRCHTGLLGHLPHAA